jgi:Mn-dependent DtxR family transcriptional regulator
MAVLKEKTLEALNVIKENGGSMTTAKLAEALGVAANSVTGRINSLVKNEMAYREKVEVEGEDKPVTYVHLTEEGMNYVHPEEE